MTAAALNDDVVAAVVVDGVTAAVAVVIVCDPGSGWIIASIGHNSGGG